MTKTKKRPAAKASPAMTWSGPDALRKLLVPIADLVPDPKNPRRHGDRNLETIRESVGKFGQLRTITVRKQGNVVVAGNGLLEVLKGLGWSHVAAAVVSLTDQQARAFAIADNRSAELAEWDLEQLSTTVLDQELKDFTGAMGFTAGEIDDLLADPEGDDDDDDELPSSKSKKVSFTATEKEGGDEVDPADDAFEPPTEPIAKPGDVWVCGEHEVLCADSFGDVAAKWIGRGRFDAVVTDPPFAIYGSSTGIASDVADDKMVRPFFAAVARVLGASLKKFGHAYVFTDWRSWASLWEALRATQVRVRNMLVWEKHGAGLGSNYANTHELIAFAHHLPAQKTMTGRKESGVRPVLKANVMRFPRPAGDEREHNAAKPVKLLQQLIENSTDPGALILEPFGGSGSTLIAAERTGRKCRAIEVEPKWVDVIVARWERTTGQKANRKKP